MAAALLSSSLRCTFRQPPKALFESGVGATRVSLRPSPSPPFLAMRQTLRFSRPLASISSPAIASEDAPGLRGPDDVKNDLVVLISCPVCFEPLQRVGPGGYNLTAIGASTFTCERCKKAFSSNNTYLDLTLTAGGEIYEEDVQLSTELFRNPLVSFAYERGWRQSFQIFGYPGPDEEFKMANKYLRSAVGGVLVDVSCASGVSTRRFVSSGLFSTVFAVDFSESMLKEFKALIEQDTTLKQANLVLLRADVGRLPFATGTIDAVHAGAAMHCWPSPSNGVAEISRILKPGGIFVATTNIVDVIRPVKQAIRQAYGGPGIWSEEELKDLCTSCGLTNWSSIRKFAFIMFTAQKPI